MTTLHENAPLFRQLVLDTAREMGVLPYMIEKDYWVTFCLKNLFSSKIGPHIVFKGGTALSKCYRAIHRFSEDVDLALIGCERLTRKSRAKKLKEISMITDNLLPHVKNGQEVLGEYLRKTYHGYPSLFQLLDMGNISNTIQIEASQLGSCQPCQSLGMQSYITDFLMKKGDFNTIRRYQLDPFSVRVLDVRRNFTEKVFALHQYGQVNAYAKDSYKYIRHMYDLHKLLEREDIQRYLHAPAFSEMIKHLRKERLEVYSNSNLWLTIHPKTQMIFKEPLRILKALNPKEKENFSRMLIGQKMPNDDELSTTLQTLCKHLENIDWHNEQESKELFVSRMYAGMALVIPYDGVYSSIVVGKDHDSIADKKQKATLHIFPMDSEERRLSQLMELTKRDGLPMKVTDSFGKAYPAQLDLLNALAKEYGVRLEKG